MKSLLEMMGEDSGGPSGYTTAFTHPDPMDPNDRVRQKTQSRATDYPYDMPVMYGRSSHAGMDGSERQDGADNGPPLARQQDQPDQPLSVWDRLSDISDSVVRSVVGSGYESELGSGLHGRMGEDGMDAMELEMDALRRDFRDSYDGARHTTDRMDSPDLFVLLTRLDPEFSAETFAPEDEDDMRGIYSTWADRMSGPQEE
jgi:hypothetical protein